MAKDRVGVCASVLLFCMVVLAGGAALADAGPSANGHASVDTFGNPQFFSFNVRDFGDEVRGQFQITWGNGTDYMTLIHGTLDCLRIEGNAAWFSGQVTNSNDPETFVEGAALWVHVVDNGEGRKAVRDQWSDFWVDVAPLGNVNDCNSDDVSGGSIPDLFDSTGGNFQVRP